MGGKIQEFPESIPNSGDCNGAEKYVILGWVATKGLSKLSCTSRQSHQFCFEMFLYHYCYNREVVSPIWWLPGLVSRLAAAWKPHECQYAGL